MTKTARIITKNNNPDNSRFQQRPNFYCRFTQKYQITHAATPTYIKIRQATGYPVLTDRFHQLSAP